MSDLSILNAKRIWIFQCNPNKYRLKEALVDEDVVNCFHWKVKQHTTEISKGDIGLIWCSGKAAGIYAITRLISDPGEFVESESEKKYWIDNSEERGHQYRVKMKLIESLVAEPIKRGTILHTKGLKDLSIIRLPRGTNFLVTSDEWRIINKLIDKQPIIYAHT